MRYDYDHVGLDSERAAVARRGIMPPKRATKCKNCPGIPMPGRAICRSCFNTKMREHRGSKRRERAKAAELTADTLREMLLGNLLRLLAREAGASSIQEAYNLAQAAGALPGDEGAAGVPLGVRIEGLRHLIPELPELADMANLMLARRIAEVPDDGEAV